MAVKPIENQPAAYVETVEEIMKRYKSLPPRPPIEEIEAALTVLQTLNTEEQLKLDEISNEQKPPDVPEELFTILKQLKKKMVLLQSHEQRREATHLVDLDKMYDGLDELIQRASLLVFGDAQDKQQVDLGDTGSKSERKAVVISDESLIKKNKDDGFKLEGLLHTSSTRATLSIGGNDTDKYSLMKVASIIELSAKAGDLVLDLQGKLMDQIEWLPVSLGKLSCLTELNISENHLMALPANIGSLTALTKFDAHSNQLINLPESFGELINLVDADLHSNRLKSLPATFGKLVSLANLDLSSNYFTLLPDIVGDLTSLKILNVETNELEELPYTIGSCCALEELRLDFNQLRALPEATGKLEHLQVLKLHYNRIKRLPSTFENHSKLREIDVSFNELEYIPDTLCFATGLVKMNVSNNFADLTTLPRSIGNLEMLEELDISNNQIRFLPESFGFLSNLRVLHADQTPLEVPPRQVVSSGAQAVVQYMADLVKMRDTKAIPTKKKGFWFWFCALFGPRKTNSTQALNP